MSSAMLGSSATSPADTVVQGNLLVKGSITATASSTPTIATPGNLTVGGSSTLTGPVSAGSTLAVTGSSLLTGPVSAGSTLAVAGNINVAGSGVIGTPSTSTSLTVNGNIAQNNIAAANTFNGQSNAFSGSVTVGGGTGPGAGLVTANGGIVSGGDVIIGQSLVPKTLTLNGNATVSGYIGGGFIGNFAPPIPSTGGAGNMRFGNYVFQWGRSNAGPTGQSVTYGTPYASNPVVIASIVGASGSQFLSVTTNTTTGFTFVSSTSAGTGGDGACFWMAVGLVV